MASDSLFGVHGAALEVRSQRMGLLASNIANASTPGFKAKDIDFTTALASVEAGELDDERLASWRKLQRELAWLARKQDLRAQHEERRRWAKLSRDAQARTRP